MLIKRAVLMLLLSPYLISTHCMIADIFTKALDKQGHLHQVPRRDDEQQRTVTRGIICSCRYIAWRGLPSCAATRAPAVIVLDLRW